MNTIFGLFSNYQDAQQATIQLLNGPVSGKDINVMVNADAARQAMPLKRRTAAIDASDEIGQRALIGLDALLGRQQPLTIAGVGNVDGEAAQVYSAGVAGGQWLLWARTALEQAGRVSEIMRASNGRLVANHR